MRLLPCGSAAVLVELDALADVLALHAALQDEPLPGVTELVPASRTVLLVLDPAVTSPAVVAEAVRRVRPGSSRPSRTEVVEVPVVYDGDDLDDAATAVGCSTDELVRRHTEHEWTVAFCGFAPGFGYLVQPGGSWDVPRRASPRTRVPAGSVALAGAYAGVYPRASPGGWQLVGRTDVAAFDLSREPAALLRPGVRVRFTRVP